MAKKEQKSLFRRLTDLFKSGPVVKKKIRTLDTTIAVPDKTKSSGALLFQKSMAPTYATITANAYNLSERLMRYQDFQEMEYTPEIAAALDIYADETCLSGDTVVPLLDGTRPTIKQLFDDKRKDFWVYSFDTNLNKIVPGQATFVVKTGTKKLFKVLFDDDTFIRLTDNHRVLLSDGNYVEVKDLKIGDSVRSLSESSDFKESFCNQIISIVEDGTEDVFDLEVREWHNFAASSNPSNGSYVFVHNCAQDEKGRVLHIYSDNEKIKEILEDLFYNTLNTEFNLRSWARSLVKFGDFFLYNDVHPDYGVTAAFPIPVNEIEREENYDPTDPMAVRYKWVTLGNKTLENWEVTHFRLLGNDMFLPYGSSVIEPARRIWRQLILIEDAMLVYRVVRAPERRVFYIDVANIPAAEIPMYVEEQRKNLRSNQVIDRNTGRVDLRYNPMSVDEDFIIPVRGTDSGTRIETLAGGQNTAAVEDVAYIQKKLFAALKIPRAYLGYDEMLSSKATLAQEDIRFSRTINVIQKVLLAELNKLAIIHLYANGYDGDDLQNFVLRLSNPSTIAQQQKLELWRAKFEIAGSAPDGFVNKNFVRKEIWGLNDEECKRMDDGRLKDKLIDQSIETASTGGEGGGGGDEGGGDDLFGGGDEGGGDLFGGDEGGDSGPGEENAAAQPTPSKLITSAHDPEDDFLDIEDFEKKLGGKTPIVPSPKVKSESKKRKVKKRKGRITTHLPDFAEMVKPETDYTDKYFFSDPFRNLGNPLAEKVRIPLSHDVVSTLKNWSKRYGVKGNNLLSEGQNVEDDDLFILDEEG
jgi:hypothetical protein